MTTLDVEVQRGPAAGTSTKGLPGRPRGRAVAGRSRLSFLGVKPGEGRKFISATTLLWLLAAAYGFPVLWFILSAFKPAGELFSYPLHLLPQHPTVKGFVEAWHSFDVALYFRNTFIVATAATVLTLVTSACSGYALAKYDTIWLKIFFVGMLATTMLPTEVMLAPSFLVVRDLRLYNNLAGVIVPTVYTATGTLMFRQFYKTVPDELLEAGRMDGGSELGLFLRVMVPIARPVFVTLAIFSFVWRWNDYIWPLLVINNPHWFTLQIGIESIVGAQNVNWSVLLGASVIGMAPLLVMYLVFQRFVMNTDLNSGLKG